MGSEQAFTETAQRVARRHSIAGGSPIAFRVISGEITLTSPSAPKADMDEEIPF